MSLARSYARALLEAAQDQKVSAQELDAMEGQLEEMVRLLESSRELRLALTGPATSGKEKADLVTTLGGKAGFSKLFIAFLALLSRKERVAQLPSIREAFASARLESEGGVLGHVTSADPVEPSDLAALAESFTRKLGKKVAFRASTDPELLAGLKVTVSGVTYDGTLRAQLQRLGDRFVAGAIH